MSSKEIRWHGNSDSSSSENYIRTRGSASKSTKNHPDVPGAWGEDVHSIHQSDGRGGNANPVVGDGWGEDPANDNHHPVDDNDGSCCQWSQGDSHSMSPKDTHTADDNPLYGVNDMKTPQQVAADPTTTPLMGHIPPTGSWQYAPGTSIHFNINPPSSHTCGPSSYIHPDYSHPYYSHPYYWNPYYSRLYYSHPSPLSPQAFRQPPPPTMSGNGIRGHSMSPSPKKEQNKQQTSCWEPEGKKSNDKDSWNINENDDNTNEIPPQVMQQIMEQVEQAMTRIIDKKVTKPIEYMISRLADLGDTLDSQMVRMNSKMNNLDSQLGARGSRGNSTSSSIKDWTTGIKDSEEMDQSGWNLQGDGGAKVSWEPTCTDRSPGHSRSGHGGGNSQSKSPA